MIAIPNMDKPKNCAECFYALRCSAVPRWVTTDESIPRGCPLMDIVICEECRYYEESEYIKGDMVCKYHIGHTYYTEADRFCYYGDRRSESEA